MPADLDEIIAVGAVAVQEHDELFRRPAPGGGQSGAANRIGHASLRCGSSGRGLTRLPSSAMTGTLLTAR